MIYTVDLEKSYYDRADPDETRTVYGKMPVEAESQEAANTLVRAEIQNYSDRCLQTVDPRIEWDTSAPDGWEYADFTFGVV